MRRGGLGFVSRCNDPREMENYWGCTAEHMLMNIIVVKENQTPKLLSFFDLNVVYIIGADARYIKCIIVCYLLLSSSAIAPTSSLRLPT